MAISHLVHSLRLPPRSRSDSELQHHCGINSWLSNSIVRRAVSSAADGPGGRYTPVDSTVVGGGRVFSHEPTLAGPTPTGEHLMFFAHHDGV